MFTLEQDLYEKELGKDTVGKIKFVDNSECISLFESKVDVSIFKLIDEEGLIKGTDSALIQKMD
eukprot:CAMPEP_0116889070 /NCGR_PEP_ID=MMETSP0463-20121206/24429_1 /TAXON_ID=181622 /ORGANISM="Strombidinopsis sp, Strain SopsisLIS2011" /LENGTH=63 /DNA_ID=CAMNT_0004555141 /DNA_START=32 /DNA_END=223 /DNA_ORIENTATION=-